MRAQEFITEASIGKYASGGIVPSSTPITRKNAKLAYDVVKSINQAPTAKDKIEVITSLKAGGSTNKISIINQHGEPYGFREYNKSTGDIELVNRQGKAFRTNVDSLEFVGKERSVSTSIKKWVFKTDNIQISDTEPQKSIQEPKKKGRPSKPKYNIPNNPW